jgi:hypothetical protein
MNGLRRRQLPVLLLPGGEPFSRRTAAKATCSSLDGHRCIPSLSSFLLLLRPPSSPPKFPIQSVHRSRGSELLNLRHFGSEDSPKVDAWSTANSVNLAQQECSVSAVVCLASGHPLHCVLIPVFVGFRAVLDYVSQPLCVLSSFFFRLSFCYFVFLFVSAQADLFMDCTQDLRYSY